MGDPLRTLPGANVPPKVSVRSDHDAPEVRRAVELLDPYISEKTEKRDGDRYQGGPV